ncbi:transposase [Clostridia bacterium]|nr:transposase [Clostridia bacterium]
MGRICKYSKEEKIKACQDYNSDKGSFSSIADSIGTDPSVVREWYLRYNEHGEEAFNHSPANQSYSKEFKQSIVNLYCSGEYSLADLGAKYKISTWTIRRWMKKHYNSVEQKDYLPKPEVYTMISKKTTFEERLVIVKWVIDNDMNYKEAASIYAVKYSLVYSWVQKYLKDGVSGLEHKKRGPKPKSKLDESSMSETEKLKYELEREKALRKKAEFRLELLKKKEEIEKKLRSRK